MVVSGCENLAQVISTAAQELAKTVVVTGLKAIDIGT
jgi:hypothetical protein